MRPVSALPSLSRESQRSLDRSIEGALRYRSGSRARLRDVVKIVIDELRVAGATGERVRAALARAVEHHPATGRLDRTSLITGAHSSQMITELILSWVDDSDRSLAAVAPAPVRARDGWPPDERPRELKAREVMRTHGDFASAAQGQVKIVDGTAPARPRVTSPGSRQKARVVLPPAVR